MESMLKERSNVFVSKVDYNRFMAKPKGSSKTGGRSKGTPNKKSQFLCEAMEAQGIDVAGELASIYKESYSSTDRVQILFKLLDYCYPKKKSIEYVAPNEVIEEKKLDYSVLTKEELQILEKLVTKMELATGNLDTM